MIHSLRQKKIKHKINKNKSKTNKGKTNKKTRKFRKYKKYYGGSFNKEQIKIYNMKLNKISYAELNPAKKYFW